MCFLGTFRTGVILTGLAVFRTVELDDLFLAGTQTEGRQVDRVSTHIGDASVFVKVLCQHHRLADSEAQFTSSFLLQSRGGKGRSRRTLQRLLANALHSESSILAFLQEGNHLLTCLETASQDSLHLSGRAIRIGNGKDTVDAVESLTLEILNLTLALNNQTYGYTLNATC